MEMKLTTVLDIDIDIEDIIRIKTTEDISLEEAIDDYVCGLDDLYYYSIGAEEKEQIKNYILNLKER